MRVTIPKTASVAPLEPQELADIPIFPLPKVVFFPGAALPLHLFEPRYRQMIEDCMNRGPRALAVSQLEPGWEDDYQGQPPIAEVAGVGRIVWHEALPDGRHNVILVGVGRARIDELPAEDVPYRRAKATLLSDGGRASDGAIRGLLSCTSAVTAALRQTEADFNLDLPSADDPSRLVDMIADQLVPDVAERQRILETLDLGERVTRVTSAVSTLLLAMQADFGSSGLN